MLAYRLSNFVEKYKKYEQSIAIILLIFIVTGAVLYIWINSLIWTAVFPITILCVGGIVILMRFVIFITF